MQKIVLGLMLIAKAIEAYQVNDLFLLLLGETSLSSATS